MSKYEELSYLYQSLPLLYDVYYGLMLYYFGFVKGLVYIFLIYEIVTIFIEKVFKLELLSTVDKTFLGLKREENFKLSLVLRMDKMDVNEMKEYLIENCLKLFKKMRCRLVKKFGLHFWQERSLEEAKKRIYIIKDESIIFNNDNDIQQYVAKKLETKFDIYNEFPYELYIIQNMKNPIGYQNIVFILTDHIIGDGMTSSLVAAGTATNYSYTLYPLNISKNMNIFHHMIMTLMFPYNFVRLLINYIGRVKTNRMPISLHNHHIKKTGKFNVAMTNSLDFVAMHNINKKLGITFNTLFCSIIISAIKKTFKKDFNYENDKINLYSMVGLEPIAKTRNKIQLTNHNSGYGFTLDCIEDPLKSYKIINNQYTRYLNDLPLVYCQNLLHHFVYGFLPIYFAKWIVLLAYDSFDLTFSNVPGSKKTLEYGKSNVIDMYPVLCSGFKSGMIVLFSYNGTFRVVLSFEKGIGYKPDNLAKEIEKTCQEVLNSKLVV